MNEQESHQDQGPESFFLYPYRFEEATSSSDSEAIV